MILGPAISPTNLFHIVESFHKVECTSILLANRASAFKGAAPVQVGIGIESIDRDFHEILLLSPHSFITNRSACLTLVIRAPGFGASFVSNGDGPFRGTLLGQHTA
jgi:hypothetical protein